MDNKWIGISEFIPKVWTVYSFLFKAEAHVKTRLLNHLRPYMLSQKGGFHLMQWVSNSCEILQAIAEEDRSKNLSKLNLDRDELPVERALGLQWCVQSDTKGKKLMTMTLNDCSVLEQKLQQAKASFGGQCLSTDYLFEAEKAIIKFCQWESFSIKIWKVWS